MSNPTRKLPIAILISGGGTTLRNLIEKIREGALPVEIRLVISSSAAARGLEYAKEAGIAAIVVERKKLLSPEDFSAAIFNPCRSAGAQYVVMGGFLKHVLIPPDYQNRVINIHPSLLPAFGGKGMYGLKVHEAVLAAGVAESGCTVHFVDNEYDHGPVLLQRRVEVRPDDTAEALQARVFAAECDAYPAALMKLTPAK